MLPSCKSLKYSVKGQILLIILVLGGSFFSCKKKENEDETQNNIKKKSKLEPVHLRSKNKNNKKKKFDIPVISEKEPNDYPNWAKMLPVGVGAKGFINPPWKSSGPKGIRPDRDVYNFTIPGPGKKILWARLKGIENIDLYLSVYQKLDRIMRQDANGVGEDEIIVNLTLKPGEYYFKLGERWRTMDLKTDLDNPYFLYWKLSEPSLSEEIEPNNRRMQANKITIGKTIKGYLSSGSDYDVFKLPGSDQVFRIDYSPPKGIDSRVSFWTETGLEKEININVKKEKLVLRRFKFKDLVEFLMITPSSKQEYSLTHKYNLKISIEGKMDKMELEPNDTPDNAKQLKKNNGVMKGYLSHSEDVDYFILNLKKDSLLTLEAELGTDTKLKLCIIKNKSKLCKKSSEAGEKARFLHQYLEKGDYYIRLEGIDSWEAEKNYTLKWKSEEYQDGDEKEPNNNRRKANEIKPGTPVRGYLSPEKDTDYYKFSLRGKLNNPPIIKLQLTGGVSVSPILILKDSWGNTVLEDKKGVYTGTRKLKTPIHPRKTYYIVVKDKTGSQTSSKVPYILRLKKEE
ncbi:MAG: hypothetical protein PF689_00075 [Deltaproteobacteria bacterium]|jgi:hypothetical protein|nr:hypothetical protein [Deltaproteobacteria bacterium]